MALLGCGEEVRALSFGHASAEAACQALPPGLLAGAARGNWNAPLVRRLTDYADGGPEDFRDVPVDLPGLTPFQRRVVRQCRKIPYGGTMTYGQLAAAAGRPRAARAVGACMASNRIALIIPCHRVVAAGGALGGYSAPGGTRTKRRLLDMERRQIP